MLRSAVLLLLCVSTVHVAALRPALGVPEEDRERLAAYLARLASTPPRDAGAYTTLAEWCAEQGLAAEAKQAYEQAMAIDEDCAAARAALGYVRYGTGWRLKEALGGETRTSPRPRGEAGVSPGAPASAEGSGASPTTEARLETELPSTGAARVTSATSRLEQKKNWAAVASEKLGLSFATYEDRDFLVHSTFSARDGDFKALVRNLGSLRKLVSSVLGVRSRTVIWPDKLQIVLLRSEPEYERFALSIDGVQSARNPQGTYTKDDHTVLWNPDGEGLARAVGGTALAQLYDSDRLVARWLEDGVEELVVAGSPWGASRRHLDQSFVDAAGVLREDSKSALLFELLEARDHRTGGSSRDAALALTLTQFLTKSSRRGFTEFVKQMKSSEAPPPPDSTDDRDSYLLKYASFQETALQTHFRATVQTLGEKWKEYVLKTGKKLEEERERERQESELKERRERSRGRYR